MDSTSALLIIDKKAPLSTPSPTPHWHLVPLSIIFLRCLLGLTNSHPTSINQPTI
ncbi:hypothetical protein BD779DRAFT_1533636, partial [Infundibulicybe gibba]